jgi:hypothetical protein
MIEVISPTPSAAGMLNVICISPEPMPARSGSTADIPAVVQAGNAKPTPIPMSANGIAICATVVVVMQPPGSPDTSTAGASPR